MAAERGGAPPCGLNPFFFRSESHPRAAVRLGGRALGEGAHRLYSTTEHGYAVQLPGWRYPLVLRADGTLAMDHYGGQWGNPADLDRLTRAYAIEAAREAAAAQGWMQEERADGSLLIYHPSGGTLTVLPDGTVDAAGFLGAGCHDAAAAIEAALGRPLERTYKRLNPFFFRSESHHFLNC